MYTFIVNPNSRSGRGLSVWEATEAVLKQRNVQYHVFFTKYQRHATSYVRDLTADGSRRTLVVLGGDGTLNEVLNGIHDPGAVTIGYIPTGSGNDFARSLHLPKDPLKALEIILNPKRIIRMDIGVIRFSGKKRKFAVSAGIGFDASICHEAAVSKWKRLLNRIHLGKFSYALIAVHRLMFSSPCRMDISLDDAPSFSLSDCWFASVMNHPCEGGGFFFCPEACPEDGLLDLLVVSGLNPPTLLLTLFFALFGKHIHFPGVHLYRCKKAVIQSSASLPVHTDGEPVFLQHGFAASTDGSRIKVMVS